MNLQKKVTLASVDPEDYAEYTSALKMLETDPKSVNFEGDSFGNFLFGYPVLL